MLLMRQRRKRTERSVLWEWSLVTHSSFVGVMKSKAGLESVSKIMEGEK